MKKLMLISGLGLMIGTVNINRAEAQVHISVNINIQPAWGPSGYDYVEFYYIPEINVYYDVANRLFCHHNRGRWISALFLPEMYSRYDFYSLYKVVLNGVRYPWKYNNRHRRLYERYCYNYAQVPIFYMKESRYHRARNNFHGWVEPRYMPKNNGRPHSNDFSKNGRNGRVGSDYRSSGNTDRPAADNSRSTGNDNQKNPAANPRNSSNGRSGVTVNRNSRSRTDRNSSVNTPAGDSTDSRNVPANKPDKNDGNSRSTSVKKTARSSEKKSSRSENVKKSSRSESSKSAGKQ
jgi:hypothetical protein